MLFKYVKEVMSLKIVSGLFRFLSMLFQIFENSVRYFQIGKYVFFKYLKRYEQTNFSRDFQIRKYTFFKYLKKESAKKFVPGIYRFVTMLFSNISKGYGQKNCSSYFQIRN